MKYNEIIIQVSLYNSSHLLINNSKEIITNK